MKKIIISLCLLISTGVAAQHRHHHFHHRHHFHHDPSVWVLSTIVGGVVGYEIARQNQQVIIQQPPPLIYIQQPSCSQWMEVRNVDGTTTQYRTCTN